MSTPTDIRDHKVDMLSTKNTDMKQRRVVNAANAVDNGDYVTLVQLNSVESELQSDVTTINQSLNSLATTVLLTHARYGTHAQRLLLTPTLYNTVLYAETDRDNILYQVQNVANILKWVYVSGVMFGTLSPDLRPTDLATGDVGFLYQTTDTFELFRWSGTAWVNQTLGNFGYFVNAASNMTLTTTPTDVPGCFISLPKAGRYHCVYAGFMNLSGADGAAFASIALQVNSVTIGSGAAVQFPNGTGVSAFGVTISNNANFTTATPGLIAKLLGFKSGGTGSSFIQAVYTNINCVWLGN
jgi:hypothetical protein